MAITTFRGMKPFSQLIFSAFIVLAVFLAFQLVAALIALPLFGIDQLSKMVHGLNLDDPKTIDMLKYFQVWQSIGLFIAPSFLIAWLLHGQIIRYLKLNQRVEGAVVMMVILLVILVNPLINFAGSFNAKMHFPEWLGSVEEWMREAEDAAARLTEAFLSTRSVGGLLFNLLMIAVLPAVGEELLFRGVIQETLTRWTRNAHWGIWLSAALFSALHMQFYGFIPRMLLAGMFGYLLHWSGSLWLPILAHFVNNAAAVMAIWLSEKNIIDPAWGEIGAARGEWHYALVSLLLSVLLLFSVWKSITPGKVTSGNPPL